MIETEDIRLSQERLNALKELITPIKDLAKNWNVDINLELEKYMLSFEADVDTDNFAEAALVIQGSADVWSKKVEFLYSLAIDSLGMLEAKQKKKDCDKDDGVDGSEDEMMTIGPAVIKKANNILVNLSTLAQTEHFKPKIPLCLSSISTKNDSIENLLYNRKGELLATQDDFTINRCLINKSGLLSLDIQTFYLLNKTKSNGMTPFYKRRVSQFDGYAEDHERHDQNKAKATEDNANGAQPALDNQLSDNSLIEVIDNGVDISAQGALDLSDDPEDAFVDQIESHSEPKTPKCSMQTRSRSTVQLSLSQGTPVTNKIEQRLNRYEEVPNKPFKKASIEKPKVNRKSGPPKTPLSEFLKSSNKGLSKSARFPNILRKPLYDENLELFKKLQVKDKTANTNIKKKLESRPQNIPLPIDLLKPPTVNPCDEDEDADGGPQEDDIEFDDDFVGTITVPVVDDGLQSHLENLETSQKESLHIHDIQLTYEDLVKQHVQKYTSEARDHFHVSELRERVLEWENKITPILDEEEKVKPFDVCYYSNMLIEKLTKCKDESAEFKNLVSGEDRSEVCRLFLTSLMLTNSGNIDMKDEDNTTKCKLVSKKLFSHVLEGYVASSVESTRKRKAGTS